jgi:hypothetical protein
VERKQITLGIKELSFVDPSGAESGVEMPRIEAGESRIEDAGYFC